MEDVRDEGTGGGEEFGFRDEHSCLGDAKEGGGERFCSKIGKKGEREKKEKGDQPQCTRRLTACKHSTSRVAALP